MIEKVEFSDSRRRPPRFARIVAEWMRRTFEAPTEAQRLAWPVIADGKNTLVFSPTGSGKTLAAFLWAINELVELGEGDDLPGKPYVVYISPLRALANDVEKNLLVPLEEMRGISDEQETPFPDIRVSVRTGDTLQRDRQRMLRRPPHILITTPESFYLLLTSRFREHLDQVRYVIVDEIHHLCGDKRGAHLAISLERLAELVADGGEDGFLRIGLSATQSPVEEIARFLVGFDDSGAERDCTIVDLGVHRNIDLQVIAPVPNLVEAKPEEVWDAIYAELYELICTHRTTLIFCNSRHLTERVAAKLNMLAEAREAELRIGAHHGSMSRVFRLEMEDNLKSGALRAIVATSSLELGIDIGHLDLVCQIESPKRVAAGLQRVGRAGHLLGLTSKGRMFATSRDDLVEMAVLARAMLEGNLEPAHIPTNCLDVAAQQVAAMAAIEGGSADELLRIVRRAYNFRDVTDEDFTRILGQLSARFGDQELFELPTRINWDRARDHVTGARGTLTLVQQNAGTIPEYAEYAVHAEDYKRKLGTLDEQFVQRLRSGQIFVLGTRTWQFLRVDRNRVYVRDGRGRAPTIPSWHGPDYIPRSFQLGEQVGAFRAAVFGRLFDEPEGLRGWLQEEYLLDESGAQQTIEYFVEQAHSLDTWPGERTIVAETSRNPLGHWQILVHSPYGSGLNEAWAEALVQAAREELDVELQVSYTDNAFALHLPRGVESGAEELLSLVSQDNLARRIETYVRESPLFSIRFRHAAVRALAVLRMTQGRKRAVWLQEAGARRIEREVGQMRHLPLVAETMRECVEDHLDLLGLRHVVGELASGRMRLVSAEVEVPSPFGHELLLAGQFGAMTEVTRRERRAELLSLHREVLRQILDEGSIRELIDPKVVEEFEARRRGTHAMTRARDAEELLRLIRRCGELSEEPESDLFIGCQARGDWKAWLRRLWRDRRAVPVVIPRASAAPRRWIASEDYLLYARAFASNVAENARHRALLRAIGSAGEATTKALQQVAGDETADLLGDLESAYRIVRCGGRAGRARWALPERWVPGLAPRRLGRLTARRTVLLRVLRGLGPVAVEHLCGRYGFLPRTARAVLRGLLETGEVQQGDFVTGRAVPQVCARANLEELHRMALAALRRRVEPVPLARYADFLLKWQHVHPKTNLDGPEAISTVLAQQAGYRAYPRIWQRDILGLRVKAAQPQESGIPGAGLRMGQFHMGEQRPRPLLAGVTFVADEAAGDLLAAPATDECSGDELAVVQLLRDQGERSRADILASTGLAAEELDRALWRLFGAGLISNTDYSSIARCAWTSTPRWAAAAFGGGTDGDEPREAQEALAAMPDLRRVGLRADEGRWYAVQSHASGEGLADAAQDDAAVGRRCRARVMALMKRYGVAARELLLAKSDMPTRDVSRGLRELFLRGQLLRGFFAETFSGDQFALPEALDRLRREKPARREPAIMVNSLDPAAIHLSAVKLPGMQNRALATRYLVLHRGALLAIVDRHAGEGRFFRVRDVRLFHPDDGANGRRRSALHRRVATAMLEYTVRWGRCEVVRIARINGRALEEGSAVVRDLISAGFRLHRGQLLYRLRKRVGAGEEETMRRIVKTEEQKREDVRIDSKAVLDFCDHILTEYNPPPDKDMLVFFQCSVSRPYSKSPSHGSMRKSIRLATGHDPRDEFDDCRCHVVVLSSVIGPVPYEMENVYPADERGGGVKHMSPEQYAAARPILAERMAEYLKRWHDRYKVITTFTSGSYGDVMEAAKAIAGVDFPVLPDMDGVRLKGGHQYWTKYWIQVFFELLKGMTDDERAEAMKRLEAEGVAIDER
ncbi:MAG: DEAD/DEAH box helicase [Armatimonadota bacterium]|jgi:ATP-dependent Lhr-like helicase